MIATISVPPEVSRTHEVSARAASARPDTHADALLAAQHTFWVAGVLLTATALSATLMTAAPDATPA